MKFKEFRQTELFKSADICEYYDSDKNPIPDKKLKKIQSKEVTGYKVIPSVKLSRLAIYLDI